MHLQLPKYTQKDRLIMLSVLPVFMVYVNYLLFGSRYFTELRVFGWVTVINAVPLIINWFLSGMIAVSLRKNFPSYRLVFRRIAIALCCHIPLTAAFTGLIFWFYTYFSIFDYSFDLQVFKWALVLGVVLNIVANVLHERVSTFERWQDSLLEAERLKKANLQSQFESLKSQVNPHFLFNSLNSLSSLISDNPQQAEQFLDEMSKVYRYLLRNNQEELVTLNTELQFIRSYFHLLQTRYGEGITLSLQIDSAYCSYLLPPLTLQMLLENAVKHNVILMEQPLHIRIYTNNDGRLAVQNNRQHKPQKVHSNGLGLTNIVSKYQLLGHSQVQITDDEEQFIVLIPLIKNETYESFNS